MNIQVVAYGKQKTKEYVEFAGLKSGQSQLRNFEQSLMRDFFLVCFSFVFYKVSGQIKKQRGKRREVSFSSCPSPIIFLLDLS